MANSRSIRCRGATTRPCWTWSPKSSARWNPVFPIATPVAWACGSCAMTVNGKPRWTCRTHVSRVEEDGVIVIEPLRNMPRIRTWWSTCASSSRNGSAPATPSWARQRARSAGDGVAAEQAQAGRRRHRMHQLRRARPVTWCPGTRVSRPAALNRAWTLFNDERHADPKDVRQATSGSGCNSCHTQGSCMKHCPVDSAQPAASPA